MRKIFPLIILSSFVMILGCGPKGASKKTMDELNEVKWAAESAEEKAENLKRERERAVDEKSDKEKGIMELEEELDSLKKKK